MPLHCITWCGHDHCVCGLFENRKCWHKLHNIGTVSHVCLWQCGRFVPLFPNLSSSRRYPSCAVTFSILMWVLTFVSCRFCSKCEQVSLYILYTATTRHRASLLEEPECKHLIVTNMSSVASFLAFNMQNKIAIRWGVCSYCSALWLKWCVSTALLQTFPVRLPIEPLNELCMIVHMQNDIWTSSIHPLYGRVGMLLLNTVVQFFFCIRNLLLRMTIA